MKLLITGGAGFIGSAVIREAIAQGHEVVNVDALTYASCLQNLASVEQSARYQFEKADICDGMRMASILSKHQPDVVMNLAAETHVDRSIGDAGEFIQTNIKGTYSLLDAARSYWEAKGRPSNFRFHHVSTDEVYGVLGDKGKFTETSPYAPNNPYSASKAAADHLVRAWGETYELPVLTTNCSNNYGPYQFPEKLIPVVILNALNGSPIPIYGGGAQRRDWLYVEDHARALLRVSVQADVGSVYNIGGNNELSNLDLATTICSILDAQLPISRGYREQICFVEDRPGHDFRYAIDAGLIEKDLGWKPLVSLESGLEKTVRWYLENKPWWSQLLDRANDIERLGAAQ